MFVPQRFVQLAWQAVKHEAPPLPRVQEFVTYCEETWLVGNYPLPLWNVFEWLCTHKQSCGRLARLAQSTEEGCIGKAHPNIFEIVEVFKKEQASTEVSLTQLSAGAAPPRRRRRVLLRDRLVTELQQRFTSNSISLEDYLSGVSAHTLVVFIIVYHVATITAHTYF